MKRQDVKPFVWGMAVGSIVLLIVVFSAGWVVTNGSAQTQAREIAAQAVLDRLGPIAVAQFMEDPNRGARLEEMKALDSWKRDEFVKAQGWAIMPGEKDSDPRVASECARLLGDLKM